MPHFVMPPAPVSPSQLPAGISDTQRSAYKESLHKIYLHEMECFYRSLSERRRRALTQIVLKHADHAAPTLQQQQWCVNWPC